MHIPRPQGRDTIPEPVPLREQSCWFTKDMTSSTATQGEPRASSGRVPHWEGDRIQQGGDTMQERFNRAGPRQMEEDAIFVLFDLGGNFEESPG